MVTLYLSLLTLACIMVFLDHVAGTKNIILATASFSSVYLLIFYSRHAITSTSCADERRTSIRAAWCASLILVLILGFQVIIVCCIVNNNLCVCFTDSCGASWPSGTGICCTVNNDLYLDDCSMCLASYVDNSWGFAACRHSWRITADQSSLTIGLFEKNS